MGGPAVAVVTTRQLLEAGMHFGHQTRRWNPKMRRFILGERNGIYIIDLNKTLAGLEEAYGYVRDLVAKGGIVLFVGTKKQTQGPIATYARACGMPFVNERWLGGMLTNFTTISSRTGKLREYEAMERAGDFDAMPKKEGLKHRRELEKLRRNLGGIRDLDRLPDTVFVIDTKKEHIAVTEANKLGMPIVAVVDTNCDPDVITYVIPGNDDAIRSGALMCRVLAEAVIEGRWVAEHQRAVAPPAPAAPAARGQLRRAGAGTTGTLDPTPPPPADAPSPAAPPSATPASADTAAEVASPSGSPEPSSAGTSPATGEESAVVVAPSETAPPTPAAPTPAAPTPAAPEPVAGPASVVSETTAAPEEPSVDGPSEAS
ncbi:MAG TPA: 30S ribosomal protein S2 [Acidimicrobiales bacterium]|nr:30S ribosomal protein S2 [Acidimicrobiales bacterium]